MSNVNTTPPNPNEIEDVASIGRNAADAKDRRLALDVCLNGTWKKKDIGQLERVDNVVWHGWRMWPWMEDAP